MSLEEVKVQALAVEDVKVQASAVVQASQASAVQAVVQASAVQAADELFISVSKEINKKMSDVGLNVKTLHILIKYVMEATEKTPLKGKEQKAFALRLIKELIDNMSDSNPEKYVLLNLYENDSISNTIELVVCASKGELGINNVGQVGSCIWNCISACMKK
jgi:hypothetical protein